MKTSIPNDATPQFANPGKVSCAVLMIDCSSSTSDYAVFKRVGGTDEQDDRPKSARFAEGLQVMRDILARDHWFSHSGELATVTFGAAVSVNPFQQIRQWQPPTLEPEGQTPTGAALIAALDLAQDRLAELDDKGVIYYRPQIVLITDGMPYGEYPAFLTAAIERAREAERAGHVSFATIGVDEDDREHLLALGFQQPPMIVSQVSWKEVFVRLSQIVSRPMSQRPLAVPATQAEGVL